MRPKHVLLTSLLLLSLRVPATAGLTPQEVLVAYNSSASPTDWSISKRVADYYCIERGIPLNNEFGLDCPTNSASQYSISPSAFIDRIQTPLKNYLESRPDIKAIVLCYGVPYEISGGDRYASVDSALTLLFNTTAWGNEPMGTWGTTPYGSGVANPYYSQRFG